MLPSHQAMFALAVAQLPLNLRAAHSYSFIRCSAPSMLLILSYHMPHVNLIPFIKAVPSSLPFPAVLDVHPSCMSFIFILSFCHRHAVASCSPSISWLCLMHATNTCCHILRLCWDSSVDPIQICTYIIVPVYIGRKCQPENSSLVLLVFPHKATRQRS